ncbi:MGMT family protein [Mycena latifolia]|nr:MGMT family protein [Mycena latifolia]
MDSAEFHAAVYDTVRLIPAQKVTSYGHIAKLIGMPNHSRHVGQGKKPLACCSEYDPWVGYTALKFLSPGVTPPVPWHRVVSSSGAISSRGPGTTGAQNQSDVLEAEGIEVTVGRTGDLRVDFSVCGWFPEPGTI